MKKYNFLLIILVVVVGCKTNNNNKKVDYSRSVTINFNLDEIKKNIHSTGLIRGMNIIHLNDKILLGDIYKVKEYKNKLYLLDRQSQKIAIYDTLGNALNTINSKGKGPNEYIRLVDFFVDPLNQTLNIISSTDRKNIVYDLNGNEVIKVEKFSRPYRNVFKRDAGYVGYMENVSFPPSARNIWILDNNLKVQDSYFDINKGFESYGKLGVHHFSAFGSKVYFNQMMDRNIYFVGNDEIYAAYTLDFDKYNLPDIKSLEELDQMPLKENINYVHDIRNFQETNNFLISKILFHGSFALCLYNKTDKTSMVVSLEPYENDVFFFSFGEIIGMDEKAIYTIIDVSSFKSFLKNKDIEKKHPVQYEKMKKWIEGMGVTEYSNPFLVTYFLN